MKKGLTVVGFTERFPHAPLQCPLKRAQKKLGGGDRVVAIGGRPVRDKNQFRAVLKESGVRAKVENAHHSKRSAALNSQKHTLRLM